MNLSHINISVYGKEAAITLHRGRRFFALPMVNQIADYQKKILESGICSDLLAMRFVAEGNELWGYYDFEGYVQLMYAYKPLTKMRKDHALLSIDVIISLIRTMLSVDNYLFISDGYHIDMDLIFIQPDTGRIKLAYIPDDQKNSSRTSEIVKLIKDISLASCDQRWNYYADEITERLLNLNESLAAIECRLREIGRELIMYPQDV